MFSAYMKLCSYKFYLTTHPRRLFAIEIHNNVHFSAKTEKMSGDYIARIRTVSHCIDTREFYFFKKTVCENMFCLMKVF